MDSTLTQLSFELLPGANGAYSPDIADAIGELATAEDNAAYGAVYTRPEVVNFILDLAGYSVDQPLHNRQLLEPSFGNGDFLFPIVSRLLASWRSRGDARSAVDDLGNAICAVELHRKTYSLTFIKLVTYLQEQGLPENTATEIARRWLIPGDYLLTPLEREFHFIVGNPPYLRHELIPPALIAAYRRQYTSIYDRADLYVPFIERSLSLLAQNGSLGFICSDRWMKNRYGSPLRNLVASQYHLSIYVDMVNTGAFHSQVSVYPAITIIERKNGNTTRVAHRPTLEPQSLARLAAVLRAPVLPEESQGVQELAGVVNGAEPWLLEAADQTVLVRRLENEFLCIEDAGCKVGIGVATGADKVFIDDYDALDVEPDRKLRLVRTEDISSGEVVWCGKGVINPFTDSGSLVNLAEYPRLSRYLTARKELVAGRHCVKNAPEQWYRTIDRITPTLANTKKLLIPDIKGKAHVVFEDGELYPHHNLYYVTSNVWDLRALQAVLLSSVCRLLVATYSTRIRGGYLRFQAQYLRRIRLPAWRNVPQSLREELSRAAQARDLAACDAAAFALYGLSAGERASIGGNGG